VRRLTIVLGVLLLGYAVLVALVWAFQRRLVYFPGPRPGATPADFGLAFEPVVLETADGVRLAAWFLPARHPGGGVVLVCHGNAGTIADRLGLASLFLETGRAVLLFDYRGYGASDGRPSEQGLYRDAEAAWAHLVERRGFEPGEVAVYGESLGGAVAIELARRRPVGRVVAEAAFTSLADLGAELYRWLPVRWLASERFDNAAKVGELTVPLLLVHSREDEIVPFAHALRLLAAAREPTALLETEGGHNDGGFTRRAEWRAAVRRFLDGPAGR